MPRHHKTKVTFAALVPTDLADAIRVLAAIRRIQLQAALTTYLEAASPDEQAACHLRAGRPSPA